MPSDSPRKKTSSAANRGKASITGITMDSSATTSAKAGTGTWTNEQKGQLFDHVCKVGETEWGSAVPGKTAQQVRTSYMCPRSRAGMGVADPAQSRAMEVGYF